MNRCLLVLAILCLGSSLGAVDEPSPGTAPPAKGSSTSESGQPFVIVGYLPYWETKSFDPSIGAYLTDVIYFSVEPTAAGDLNHRDISQDMIERLHATRKEHHTRIEISIGGWGRAKAMPSVALDPAKRRRFIDALAKYCQDNEFDGVDFDWEFPRGKDETAAFAALLTECKAALAPSKRILTIAVNPDQRLSVEVIAAVDRVNLMSYNHEGPEHSTLAQAEADVKQALARGVPANKLVLGVPFYGRNVKARPHEIAYAEIVARSHPAHEVDSDEHYSFNGLDTIRAKTHLAVSRQLGGIMIWELGQDTRDDSSLLRAIHVESAKH